MSQISAQESNQLSASSNEEILKAKVIQVIEEKYTVDDGRNYVTQKLKLQITEGSIKDRNVIVLSGNLPIYNSVKYKAGDAILLGYID